MRESDLVFFRDSRQHMPTCTPPLTFAVAGCEGMALVDKGGDTTKHSVVYRYACAFHNYIRCPFVVRIRVLVCSLTTSRTVCFFLFQTNCQSHTTLCHMW